MGLCILGLFVLGNGFAGAVELRVMTVWGGQQKEYLEQAFAEFTSLHPDIKISHEVVAGTGAATYIEVLKSGIASGTGPDV